jgi:hypothetical protein
MSTHLVDDTAMTDSLQLTLAMEPPSGDGDAAMADEMVDALVSDLIADLNSIESVRAEQARAEAPEGSKAVGAFLLGVLQAEVSLENAIKVARFLKTTAAGWPAPAPDPPQAGAHRCRRQRHGGGIGGRRGRPGGDGGLAGPAGSERGEAGRLS